MPKQQKRRVRSNCWYFYEKTVDGGICNMCKKEVRSTGNTTNLLNHLKRRHTVQYTEVLTNPVKYSVALDEDSHSDHDDESAERKQDEAEDAARSIEEANQSHSMEAFHADQGGTVIWLQPTADQQANSFQPQITIVQHSVQENSEGQQGEGETILGTGEIVSNNALPAIEDGSAMSVAHKPSADNHFTQTHRKTLVQNSTTGKTSTRPSFRPQGRSFGNPSPVKAIQQSTESTNHASREDSFDAFGRYVASLLRNLSSKKAACRLQKDIVWLVLQEQMRNEDC